MADNAENMIPDASSEEKAVAPSAGKAKKQGKKNASDKKPNFFVRIGRRIGKFFRDCISEMKKVVWMSGSDVRKSSTIVIVSIVILSLAIGVVDLAFSKLIELIRLAVTEIFY